MKYVVNDLQNIIRELAYEDPKKYQWPIYDLEKVLEEIKEILEKDEEEFEI